MVLTRSQPDKGDYVLAPTSGADAAKEDNKHETSEDTTVNLKQEVGLLSGTALIVGTMIGSGIFVSPGGVLARTGSVGTTLVIWVACGVLSLMGSICYIELGMLVKRSGGEYAYFLESFGQLPAFLFSWVSILILKTSSQAIQSLTCAYYLLETFFRDCEKPEEAAKLVAILCISLITVINCYSVKWVMKLQNIFTATKLAAFAIIIIGGIYRMALGHTYYLEEGFKGTTTSYGSIATAFYSGLWAYDGWNNLNFVTEEIKNPQKNLPRALLLGIPLVTLSYLLVNISYLTVLSPAEVIASDAVAVGFGDRILGVMSFLMPLSVAVSTFGAAHGSQFTGSRICYATAREGHIADLFSYIHVRRMTPAPALLFNVTMVTLLIVMGNIYTLIDFFSFTAWIFYGGAVLALIVMRFTKKDEYRPFKVPIVIPVVTLLVSAYLVVAPILDNPQIEYLYAFLFIIAGVIFYIPFIHFNLEMPGMEKFTIFSQALIEVVPPEKVAED